MKNFAKTYKNGLRLVLEKNEKNVIGLNILFFVGSQNENKDEEGLSHFIEHLVFKGTEKRTALELSDELTMLGADFNAYTSRTVTRYVFKCLKENFEKCFEIYSDMLINSAFRNEDIDKEREVVIEEMKKCADDPLQVLYERVMVNYFGDNSYAHDELGREEIIKNVSREKLLEYKNRFYKPNNCIISVAGNIEFDELDKIVQKYFFQSVEDNLPNLVDYSEFDINVLKQFDIVNRDDNQVNVCIHIKSVTADSKLKSVADIYTSILGNSQNSRLYKRIREELGFVYTIYAFSVIGARAGEIFIIFGTRAKNVKKSIEEIGKIIHDFATNGATETELVMAKNLKKSSLEYAFETNSDVAEINGTNILLFERVVPIAERVKMIDSVTLEDVNSFAKQISNEKIFNVVAVGKNLNLKDIECFSK